MPESQKTPVRVSPTRQAIPAVIVDQSAVFRAGLSFALTSGRFRIAVDGASLDDVVGRTELDSGPTMLLLGLNQASSADLAQVSVLKMQYDHLRVIALTDRLDLEELVAAIQAGVDGYLLKSHLSADDLLQAMELVLLGRRVLPQHFADVARTGRHDKPGVRSVGLGPLTFPQVQLGIKMPVPDQVHRLSDRERLILRQLTEGASNKYIARDLNITEATVKVHIKAILRKIRAKNRGAAP